MIVKRILTIPPIHMQKTRSCLRVHTQLTTEGLTSTENSALLGSYTPGCSLRSPFSVCLSLTLWAQRELGHPSIHTHTSKKKGKGLVFIDLGRNLGSSRKI